MVPHLLSCPAIWRGEQRPPCLLLLQRRPALGQDTPHFPAQKTARGPQGRPLPPRPPLVLSRRLPRSAGAWRGEIASPFHQVVTNQVTANRGGRKGRVELGTGPVCACSSCVLALGVSSGQPALGGSTPEREALKGHSKCDPSPQGSERLALGRAGQAVLARARPASAKALRQECAWRSE